MSDQPEQSALLGRIIVAAIAVVLLSSAVLRGLGVGSMAMAEVGDSEVISEEKPVAACQPEADYVPILNALIEREQAVFERETEIRETTEVLTQADKTIREKLGPLKQAEQQLRSTIAAAQSAAETDVTQLTQVYENMKPKDASALFQKMDAEFAAGFLGRMSPKAAADILTGLEADQAYAISVHLAGRNAEIPLD